MFKVLDILWWYFALALFIGLAVWRIWKKPSLGLFAGYTVLLFAETVLIRHSFTGKHFQPELFWSWKAWDKQREQILTNVVMFIPIGILSGHLWKWRGLWFGAGLSFMIEILQLTTARGLMEFDDVMHNCLGAVIGIVGVMIFRELVLRRGVSSE